MLTAPVITHPCVSIGYPADRGASAPCWLIMEKENKNYDYTASDRAKRRRQKIKKAGIKVGITLRPATALSEIEPYLDKIDLALVMTVNPGFGGQSFMEDQVDKINRLAELREKNNYNYLIQVDGGVTDITKKQITKADVLVAGSFIFKNKDGYGKAIELLKEKS